MYTKASRNRGSTEKCHQKIGIATESDTHLVICWPAGISTGLLVERFSTPTMHPMTPLVQGTHVPQPNQQHPHRVKGKKVAAYACTMQVTPHVSVPGLTELSGKTCMTHGLYRPQQPPQKQQHDKQQIASIVARALVSSTKQHVTSSM